MQSFNIKSLTEGGLLTALTVVAALISVYIPILGMVASLIWPLPIIVLIVRHGMRWGLISTMASCLLMMILIEPTLALRLIIGFAFPAITLGYGFLHQWEAAKTLLTSLVVAILSSLGALGIVLLVTGINPLDMQLNIMKESFDTAISLYETMGLSPEEIEHSRSAFEQAFSILDLLMPLVLLVGGLMVTLANFAVGGKILRRLGHPVTVLPPFNEWRLPRGIALAFGFALVGMYWGSTRELDILYQCSINLFFTTMIAGFIQGASLLSTLSDKLRFPRWLFWVIITIMFLNGIMAQIISFAGLFDMFFDYRRRANRTGNKD